MYIYIFIIIIYISTSRCIYMAHTVKIHATSCNTTELCLFSSGKKVVMISTPKMCQTAPSSRLIDMASAPSYTYILIYFDIRNVDLCGLIPSRLVYFPTSQRIFCLVPHELLDSYGSIYHIGAVPKLWIKRDGFRSEHGLFVCL